MLHGWFAYFKHARRLIFGILDGFVRRRLRAILRKQESARAWAAARPTTSAGPRPSSRSSGCSPLRQPGCKRDSPDEETDHRRAVCGTTARAVRRAGRTIPFPPPTQRPLRSRLTPYRKQRHKPFIYYPAIIEQAEGNLSVFFPDLDGLASAGDTIKEAACHAEEVLAFHLKKMRQAGDDIPAPTPIETIPPLDEGEEIRRILVKAFIPGNASRIDILVKDDPLQQIDDAAKRIGADRSGFLADAAGKSLHAT